MTGIRMWEIIMDNGDVLYENAMSMEDAIIVATANHLKSKKDNKIVSVKDDTGATFDNIKITISYE